MSKVYWGTLLVCVTLFLVGAVSGYAHMASPEKASRPVRVQVAEVLDKLPEKVRVYRIEAPAAKTVESKADVIWRLTLNQLRTQYVLAAKTPLILPVAEWVYENGYYVGEATYAIYLKDGIYSNLSKSPPLVAEFIAYVNTIAASADLVCVFAYRLVKKKPTEDDRLWTQWLTTVSLCSGILIVWAVLETLSM
jgi:hypothetical protein